MPSKRTIASSRRHRRPYEELKSRIKTESAMARRPGIAILTRGLQDNRVAKAKRTDGEEIRPGATVAGPVVYESRLFASPSSKVRLRKPPRPEPVREQRPAAQRLPVGVTGMLAASTIASGRSGSSQTRSSRPARLACRASCRSSRRRHWRSRSRRPSRPARMSAAGPAHGNSRSRSSSRRSKSRAPRVRRSCRRRSAPLGSPTARAPRHAYRA